MKIKRFAILITVFTLVFCFATGCAPDYSDYAGTYKMKGISMPETEGADYYSFVFCELKLKADGKYTLSYKLKEDTRVVTNDKGNDDPSDDELLPLSFSKSGSFSADGKKKTVTFSSGPIKGKFGYADKQWFTVSFDFAGKKAEATFALE